MQPLQASSLRLPSPPQALARVIQAASDPTVPVVALARAVSSDAGLSVQLLRMVNSSMYNRGSRIATVDRAVAILGNRSLRNLALCVAVQNCVRGGMGKFDLDGFWEDSLRRAVAARMLAESFPQADVDPVEAFTFGLLQDLGVVALVQTAPERAEAWMAGRARMAEDRRRTELEVFGMAHDDIAESLINAWSLPAELAMPMRHHHHPALAPAEFRSRCMLAGQAELLAQVLRCDDKRAALGAARAGLAREVGMRNEEVDTMLASLATRVDEVGRELGFRVGRQPSMDEILAAANAGLVELNLTYEEVVRRLERALADTEALSKQLAERNRELEQLSVTDALTSLPNRRALSGRLSYELAKLRRAPGAIAFVMGDLDKFKSVNDTWGHDFGDMVLKAAANALRESAAPGELVCRIGGEEFGIVLPGLLGEGAVATAERLRASIAAVSLVCPDGQARQFTVSLGVAWIEGPAPTVADPDAVAGQLYRAADRALYEAKRAGRNRVAAAVDTVGWESPAPVRAA
jgi:diguanylate cyclase (GGDEF)-like protein